MECRNIDELMMDFLYQELDQEKAAEFRAHVDQCARCGAELASLDRTRQVMRRLPEADPPIAISARLLAEAARRSSNSAHGQGHARGFWEWLGDLLTPLAQHPALAAAASLVLVAGVAGYLAVGGKVTTRPATVAESGDDFSRTLDRAPAGPSAPAPAVAPAGQGAGGPPAPGGLGQMAGGGGIGMVGTGTASAGDGAWDQLKAEDPGTPKESYTRGKLAEASEKKDSDRAGFDKGTADRERAVTSNGKPMSGLWADEPLAREPTGTPGVGGNTGGLESAASNRAPAGSSAGSGGGGSGFAVAADEIEAGNDANRDRAEEGTSGRFAGASQQKGVATATPTATATKRAQSSQAETGSTQVGSWGGAQAAAPASSAQAADTQASSTDPARTHAQARKAAASGDCAKVNRLLVGLARSAPEYYKRSVLPDPELARCTGSARRSSKVKQAGPSKSDVQPQQQQQQQQQQPAEAPRPAK